MEKGCWNVFGVAMECSIERVIGSLAGLKEEIGSGQLGTWRTFCTHTQCVRCASLCSLLPLLEGKCSAGLEHPVWFVEALENPSPASLGAGLHTQV